MKANLIEIGIPTDNISTVVSALEECLLETGDLLIGQHVYDDQTLFVIQLVGDTLPHHLDVLSQGFHKHLLDSFQVIACHLFKVVFADEYEDEILRSFPLQTSEAWFRAANDVHAAYLCLSSSQLNHQQTAWLATHPSVVQWTKES